MRILYATDGSEGALAGAQFLAGLPHHRNVHVHIVTARDSDDPNDGGAILVAAEEVLGKFPGHVTTATTRADSTSEIVETLLCTADYIDADLIVMGASGRSAVARFFMGSVSEAIARHAPIPVLLARSSELPLRSVVIGMDGSSDARNAACFAACKLPLPADCALHLVQAVPQPFWAGFPDPMLAGTAEAMAVEATEAEQTKAREMLTGIAQELRESGAGSGGEGRAVEAEAIVGNPASVLLDTANAQKAGLVVVGSHGMSGMERFLLGSVSERVLRHAHCSVLVVKRRPEDVEILA
jgi:nucleotide-binding universal stress UspA family protein